MKKEKAEPFIVFMGRYRAGSILSGPEKTAKRIFDIHSLNSRTAFIQYFFDGAKFGTVLKLFGKESRQANDNSIICTAGLIRIFFLLFHLKPDLIHIITYERFAIAAFLYKLFSKVKIVYNAHGIVAFEDSAIKSVSWFYKSKDRLCEWVYLKFSDIAVFFSEKSLDKAREYFKIDESKVLIFSNGIDEAFHMAASKRTPGTEKSLKAVIINSGDYQKSGTNFLMKLPEICDINFELYMITGLTNINLNSKNISLFCSNKMESEALADFYMDKDIFLSLNNYDTFSIASVEAMAAGLIPIVTRQTGMSRFILNGENGYSIDYNDVENMNKYLKEISVNHELKNSLSKKASEIYEILSWQNIYESYTNLYGRLTP